MASEENVHGHSFARQGAEDAPMPKQDECGEERNDILLSRRRSALLGSAASVATIPVNVHAPDDPQQEPFLPGESVPNDSPRRPEMNQFASLGSSLRSKPDLQVLVDEDESRAAPSPQLEETPEIPELATARQVQSITESKGAMSNGITQLGEDVIQEILEDNARRLVTQPGGHLKERMRIILNRTKVPGGLDAAESLFQSHRPIALLLRRRWFCLCLLVILALWIWDAAVVSLRLRARWAVSHRHFRFTPLHTAGPGIANLTLLLDGCRESRGRAVTMVQGGTLVLSYDTSVTMNGWALTPLPPTAEEGDVSGGEEGDEDGDVPAHFVLEGSDDLAEWRVVGAGAWRYSPLLDVRYVPGAAAMGAIDSDGESVFDLRAPWSLVLNAYGVLILRSACLVSALLLIGVAGRAWYASCVLVASFQLSAALELVASMHLLSVRPRYAVVPLCYFVFDQASALLLTTGIPGRVLVETAMLGNVNVLAKAVELAIVFDDAARFPHELPLGSTGLVLLGLYMFAAKRRRLHLSGRSMRQQQDRYQAAWEAATASGGEEAVKASLTRELWELKHSVQRLKRPARHTLCPVAVATSQAPISRVSSGGFQSGVSVASATAVESKRTEVKDIDQVYRQARGLERFVHAKVWQWASRCDAMLPAKRTAQTREESRLSDPSTDSATVEVKRQGTGVTGSVVPRGLETQSTEARIRLFGRGAGREERARKSTQRDPPDWRRCSEMEGGRDGVEWAPLKGQDRGIVKVVQAYAGDPSKLLDVCRQRMVFGTLSELFRCVSCVVEDHEVVVHRIKNMLRTERVRHSGGFRAVVLNVSIRTAETARLSLDGHLAEIQLLLHSIAEVEATSDHRAYIHYRNSRALTETSLGRFFRKLSSKKHRAGGAHRGGGGVPGRQRAGSAFRSTTDDNLRSGISNPFLSTAPNRTPEGGGDEEARKGVGYRSHRRSSHGGLDSARLHARQPSPDASSASSNNSGEDLSAGVAPIAAASRFSPLRMGGWMHRRTASENRRGSDGTVNTSSIGSGIVSPSRAPPTARASPDLSSRASRARMFEATASGGTDGGAAGGALAWGGGGGGGEGGLERTESDGRAAAVTKEGGVSGGAWLRAGVQSAAARVLVEPRKLKPRESWKLSQRVMSFKTKVQAAQNERREPASMAEVLEKLFATAVRSPGGQMDDRAQKSAGSAIKQAKLVSAFFTASPMISIVSIRYFQLALIGVALLYFTNALPSGLLAFSMGKMEVAALRFEATSLTGGVPGAAPSWAGVQAERVGVLLHGCEVGLSENRQSVAVGSEVQVTWPHPVTINGWFVEVPAGEAVRTFRVWYKEDTNTSEWQCLRGGRDESECESSVAAGGGRVEFRFWAPWGHYMYWVMVPVSKASGYLIAGLCGVVHRERLARFVLHAHFGMLCVALLAAAGVLGANEEREKEAAHWPFWVAQAVIGGALAVLASIFEQSLIVLLGAASALSVVVTVFAFGRDGVVQLSRFRSHWLSAVLVGDAAVATACATLAALRVQVLRQSRDKVAADKKSYDEAWDQVVATQRQAVAELRDVVTAIRRRLPAHPPAQLFPDPRGAHAGGASTRNNVHAGHFAHVAARMQRWSAVRVAPAGPDPPRLSIDDTQHASLPSPDGPPPLAPEASALSATTETTLHESLSSELSGADGPAGQQRRHLGLAPVHSIDQLFAQATVVHYCLWEKVKVWAEGSRGLFLERTKRRHLGERARPSFIAWSDAKDDPTLADRIKWGKLKSESRAVEKQLRTYKGDTSRLVDVARQSVAFRSVADLTQCLTLIDADAETCILRAKNRLDPDFDSALSVGYRDVALNLALVDEQTTRLGAQWHVCEVQLILVDFAMLKSDDGHKRYVQFRNARAE